MKRRIVFVFVFLVGTVLLQAGNALAGDYGPAIIDTDELGTLNLRSGPSTDSEIIGWFYSGTEVIQNTHPLLDEWIKVTIGAQTGYMHSDYLKRGNEGEAVFSEQPIGIITAPNGVVLRQGPTTDEGIITMIESGEAVLILGETREKWCLVQYREKQGYIEGNLVELQKSLSNRELFDGEWEHNSGARGWSSLKEDGTRYNYVFISPEATDISQNDAAQIALSYTMQMSNCIALTAEGFYDFRLLEVKNRRLFAKANFVSVQEKQAWVISFFPEGIPAIAATVVVSSPSGEVIDAFFGWETTIVQLWEEEKGPMKDWSFEERHIFDVLYKSPINTECHVIPDETDITLQEAMEIAEQGLANELGISLNQVEKTYEFEYELIETRSDVSNKRWRVLVKGHNENDQLGKLYFSIYIDAQTGQLLMVDDQTGGLG